MTAGGERSARVLVVRCPAWSPPGSPADQADEQEDQPDARSFEAVVSSVQEFCPQLEVMRPGICAFGVRGPARYFGGEAELARKIAESVTHLGFGCGIGVADGLFAALLASRDSLISADLALIVPPGGTPAYLAPRSVTVLGEPELAELLVRLGIGTLGDFAALEASDVENRFGPQGLLAHRLARGLDPRPLVTRPPLADVSVQQEFDPPAEQSEPVVFAAKALAGQMHARLAENGLACVRLNIQVTCDNGQVITRLWRHDGLLSDLAVAERVRWQLDGWLTSRGEQAGDGAVHGHEGVQAAGVCLLRLVPDQLVRDHGRQLGLWGDAVVSDRVARAAVRVQAMLGHDAVRQPVLTGGRGPADQAMFVPFGDARPVSRPAGQGRQAQPWPGRIPAPAPATVYQVPRPARVTDGSGSTVTVTGRGEVSAGLALLSVAGGPALAIIAWTGPWPVTERWWDPVQACRKARFQLVTVDGSAWLAAVRDSDWFIEACYD